MKPSEIPAYVHEERQKRWAERENLTREEAVALARKRLDSLAITPSPRVPGSKRKPRAPQLAGPDRQLALEDFEFIVRAGGPAGEVVKFGAGAVMPLPMVELFQRDETVVFVKSMEAFVRLGRRITNPAAETAEPEPGAWMKYPKRTRVSGFRSVVHAVHGRILVKV